MHIRFNSSIAGHNFSYSPGDVVNWPDEEEAERMCERGIAEELTQEMAQKTAASSGRPVRNHRIGVERAVRTAPEKAMA